MFGYDSLNNRVVETNAFSTPLAARTQYFYNTNGAVLATTNALGHTNGFQYNGYQQLERSWDARGNITTNVYDSMGNLATNSAVYGRITVSGDLAAPPFAVRGSLVRSGNSCRRRTYAA